LRAEPTAAALECNRASSGGFYQDIVKGFQMRNSLIVACLTFWLAAPAHADVAPLTPEGRIMMEKREAFEEATRARFGRDIVERLRDWRLNYGAVLVGQEGKNPRLRLLIKDEYGWYDVRPGATQRLPLVVGHELNRLMLQQALWMENSYSATRPCRGSARLFILWHAGRDTFGREPCGSRGLAGRAADVAEKLRVPAGVGQTTAASTFERPPRGLPPGQQELTRHIFHRLSDMAAAFERKLLAGFVDPYAEDVIVERPEGVLRGRKAVVDWARRLQDWSPPGMGSRMTLHQANFPPVLGDSFYATHELRWEEAGRPLRQTFSTLWRNNGGLWQIVHERVSEVKPVTGERPGQPGSGSRAVSNRAHPSTC
jgi:ketosteroid isomerase-like protein